MVRRRALFQSIAAVVVFLSLIAPTCAADLSHLTSDDRQNIQIACVGARSSGPVAYNACVAQQTASLAKDTPPTSPVSLPLIVRTSRLLAWARVAAGQSPTTPASPV